VIGSIRSEIRARFVRATELSLTPFRAQKGRDDQARQGIGGKRQLALIAKACDLVGENRAQVVAEHSLSQLHGKSSPRKKGMAPSIYLKGQPQFNICSGLRLLRNSSA
jgi:hypothetical protein